MQKQVNPTMGVLTTLQPGSEPCETETGTKCLRVQSWHLSMAFSLGELSALLSAAALQQYTLTGFLNASFPCFEMLLRNINTKAPSCIMCSGRMQGEAQDPKVKDLLPSMKDLNLM